MKTDKSTKVATNERMKCKGKGKQIRKKKKRE